MKFRETIKSLSCVVAFLGVVVFLLYALSGFGNRPQLADQGVKDKILHLANGSEPSGIDVQTTTGVPESQIQLALTEGLVSEDPLTSEPVPAVAERWSVSEEGNVYTFYFRDALWSNGDPVTAQDFVLSYKRALSVELGNEYAYMLFGMVNAEAYFDGEIDDFDRVGVKALDDRTLQVTLRNPIPYFLGLINHHSWWPVHIASILENGELADRTNRWARLGTFVSNGPFVLSEWKVNTVLSVKKNPLYWDADTVKLEGISFYPIESLDTEERAFRAGQVHKTDKLPLPKIPFYIAENNPELLNVPYLGSYFYVLNTRLEALKDKRVRRALSLSIDRESIVRNVTGAGEVAAYSLVPPDCAGFNSRLTEGFDIQEAQRLLAEAGYPGGEGFPSFSILYNTLESHKSIAEAIQQMWKDNLGIEVGLENQEWKVYLDTKVRGDFQIVRQGWIGDYVDPNAFLELYTSSSGNNNSGWANVEYDKLIAAAAKESDPEKRLEIFHDAEVVLADEVPIIPIYFYMSTYLIDERVKGWHPHLRDKRPYKYVYFEE